MKLSPDLVAKLTVVNTILLSCILVLLLFNMTKVEPQSQEVVNNSNASVSRSVFADSNTISLDYNRVKDYAGKHSSTYTIDDVFYF